eukprot:12029-Heterococcus_DN1.PRE.2
MQHKLRVKLLAVVRCIVSRKSGLQAASSRVSMRYCQRYAAPTLLTTCTGIMRASVFERAMAAVERAPERQFVSISYKLPDSSLGSVFSKITEVLLERGWLLKATSKTSGKEDLILGTAQAGGLNYKQLGRGQKQPLVNFYRGYEVLCRKSQMVDTLRAHSHDSSPWLPRSFLFYPAKPERSETEAFTAYFNACALLCLSSAWQALWVPSAAIVQNLTCCIALVTAVCALQALQDSNSSDSSSSNLWILKPSDGGKGQRTAQRQVLQLLQLQQAVLMYWETTVETCSEYRPQR